MVSNIANQTALPKLEAQKTSLLQRLSPRLPAVLWIVAAVVLLASIAFPYWGMTMRAPQFPESQYSGGLRIRLFVNQITGDEDPKFDEVREIDELNHYIGMGSLYEAAKFERTVSIPALIAVGVALVIAAVIHFVRRGRWTWLLAVPAVTVPFVFLAYLAYLLNYYGQNLDPYAALSSSIHPFTPPVLGPGKIGQFVTDAYVMTGWYFALAAAILVGAALVMLWAGSRQDQKALGSHAS